MDSKRFAVGTVVGGVVLWAVAWVIFNKLFAAYYAANAGSATGVGRTDQIYWAVGLSQLAYAALITYTIGRKGGTPTLGQGALVGAIVGCLLWACADLVFYGSTNIANLNRTLLDPVLEFVHGGIGGAAIAFVVSKMGGSGGSAG